MLEGLVSTIIPVYNRPAMLAEAVDSVLAQTWRPIEIIIVDDGSTDATPAVAEVLRDRHPGSIRILRQSNAGPGVARQRGLDSARGEFIQFLDSDDLLLPDKFALQVDGLRRDTDADISYGKSYASSDGLRASEPAQRTGEALRSLFPALLQGPLWPTMTPLYRRRFLDRIGPWPTTRLLEDWVYDAQAALAGATLQYVDSFVAETRNHGEARLCHQWKSDPAAMHDRLDAHLIVLAMAKSAGIAKDAPEMRRYVRNLFWLARVAGSAGMPSHARRLLDAARAEVTGAGLDLMCFSAATRVLGWRVASRLAESLAAVKS